MHFYKGAKLVQSGVLKLGEISRGWGRQEANYSILCCIALGEKFCSKSFLGFCREPSIPVTLTFAQVNLLRVLSRLWVREWAS